MAEPIILRYHSEDFLSLDRFQDILSRNSVTGQQQVSRRACNTGDLSLLVENAPGRFKGIDYGRLSEGYKGPMVHLGFLKPIKTFSIAYACEPVIVKGNSEDSIYFTEQGSITFKSRTYHLNPGSFVFLENDGSYEIRGNSLLISRFGSHDELAKADQKSYELEEEVQTCQWAFMDLVSGSTIAPHVHNKKDEFFYFSGNVDIDTDIKEPKNPEYSKRKGFIPIKQGNSHSMQANYSDVWFHSLNMPDILNDSRRL
ncbi:MAG: hypothetical protein KKE20_03685 [Nanoarchaeota archaeon]|nr:hypothetical protein [Nanoarchaeota archaeon]